MSYVLIVDPDSDRCESYKGLLASQGLQPVVAFDATQATLELIKRGRPTLVLSELSFPKLDGFQFLRELRDAFPGAPVPTVVVSASLELRNLAVREKRELGIAAILAKTSPLTTVYRVIGQAIGKAGGSPAVEARVSEPPSAEDETEVEAEFEVNDQVELAVSEVQGKFPGCRVDLWLSDLPPVHGKPQQLVWALVNLLTNAAQSAAAGARIAVSTSYGDDTISIHVRDNGEGMSPEIQGKLFKPRFTTRTEGAGMGLAVSHGLVKSFGGDIEVETAPGKGSCFTVVLPADAVTILG